MTRVVEPGTTRDFTERNDEALWQCLCQTHSQLANGVRRVGFAEHDKSSTSCLLVQLG